MMAVLIAFCLQSTAQLPERVLVGYWHNWHEGASLPFIKLKDIDDRYNVVCLSFAVAQSGNPANMQFNMYSGSSYNNSNLKADIAAKQAEDKVVLMSIGGATGSFRLSTTVKRDGFVSSMKTMIQEYGVDGIDIDLEQRANVCMYSGTIQSPTDPHVVNMISALTQLLSWYQTTYGKKMILTMAPETVYVEGGLSTYQVNYICGGSYLPIIEALRDDLDLLMVQLYNSGEMFDLDLKLHYQGTQSFVTSQTDAIIRGFTAVGGLGYYSGLDPSQIAIALPSCPSAGSGYINPTTLKPALNYLLGQGGKVGNYTIKTPGQYPTLRGMMTWSINNDAKASCAGAYEYAQIFEDVFYPLITSSSEITTADLKIYPNPATDYLTVEQGGEFMIYNMQGALMSVEKSENNTIYIGDFSAGIYFVAAKGKINKFVKK